MNFWHPVLESIWEILMYSYDENDDDDDDDDADDDDVVDILMISSF